MNTRAYPPPISGWKWFPWWIAAALGVTIAANIVLIWAAAQSFPGEAAAKPYEVGTAYNQVLANAARQAEQGWHVDSAIEDGKVRLHLTDKRGASLDAVEVTGTLERPVGSTERFVVSFVPAAEGVYLADRPIPAAGQWDLKLEARQGETIFKTARRVIAP